MEICVKIFAIMALMCFVSALPVDEQQQQQQQVNEPQIDLLTIDNSPLTDSDSAADDLTRNKRHHGWGGGYGNLTKLKKVSKNILQSFVKKIA